MQTTMTCSCGLDMIPLNKAIGMCRRCDTTAQGNSMRVGPPNTPGTRDGWFTNPFGDRK